MTAKELRDKYLQFFESKGHIIIPSASLIPEKDESVKQETLFITAGMQPLIPYLMGKKHPVGNKLVNIQKCIRTQDIDDVGDNRHLTFFEMMGNWSLGGYFKEDAIKWSWEFLTDKKWLGLDPKRIYVTVFRGEDGIPRDEEAIKIWKEVFESAGIEAGVAEEEIIKDNVRIIPLGKEDNFWIAGETGPCGGDTEIFYDMSYESEGKTEGNFSQLVNAFRLVEIWNNVFMEFDKTANGKYEKLSQQNVDTGMGLERTLFVLDEKGSVFETELFMPIFRKITEISGKKNIDESFRIIADHIKASVFLIADDVLPLNVGAGYVLRRLIRRAIRHGKILGLENNFTKQIAEKVVEIYQTVYPEVKKETILEELEKEENKFRKTLDAGLVRFNNFLKSQEGNFELKQVGDQVYKRTLYINEDIANIIFDLYQTYGFPLELVFEELEQKEINIDKKKLESEFIERLKKHQELSRTASAGMFKGGLADSGEETKKLHTVAHLMLEALRRVLGEQVFQKGSNITAERLRFDFSYPEKMTPEQIREVEDLVNEQIEKKLPVVCEEMTLEEAKAQKAMGVFESKYGEKVKVYSIGDFSKEICGGPHVSNTSELGRFKIQKEESSSAGVRRIKAILE